MRKFLIPFLFLLGMATSGAFAQNRLDPHGEELNERDFDALRDFLRSKREKDIEDKKAAAEIVFSGDIRFEWRHMTETLRGETLRGGHRHRKRLPVSRDDWDVEFDLRIDYKADCSWAVAQLEFDNSAGVDDSFRPCDIDSRGCHGSGECDELCLKKAYFGYRLYECGCNELIIELGRRGNLYHVFDSKIQFLSRLDGVFLRYGSCWDNTDWYWSFAGFIVDERVEHYAWCTEIGFLNIYDSAFDFKYSFIDWEKHGRNRCFKRNPIGYEFLNSQFTLAYHFDAELLNQKATAFGAFLINHAGNNRLYFRDNKPHHAKNQNKAWYAGFIVGEVRKEGDYSFEVRYEYVEAFSIPDEDTSGICNGNVRKTAITQRPDAGGYTNYKGWRFEGLYAVTDNITIDTQLEWSHAIDTHITGSHNYSKLEIETIYAF